MLLLLFQAGEERYAIDASAITEVLPLVEVRPIPQAPAAVAGVFDFRGSPVPLIDSSVLVLGRPAARRLNTRIVVVGYPDGAGGTRPLGIIVEKAIRTVRRETTDFVDSGVTSTGAPYLGPLVRDDGALVQWIDISRLLPATVRDALFKSRVEQPWPVPTSNAC